MCATAAGAAEPFRTAEDVNGTGWQLTICEKLASGKPRGVLVTGPQQCGKSHIGHQLHEILPKGTVSKILEADQADIYAFGTDLGEDTVLLVIDEFSAKTDLAKMRNLLDKHSAGLEVRTGSSKSGRTHSKLPRHLVVLLTSNWQPQELVDKYKEAGATDVDIAAFWERVALVDLFHLGVVTRPEAERVDLDPARVAATIASASAQEALPFVRQAVPATRERTMASAPAARPLMQAFPHLEDTGERAAKRRRWSAPPAFLQAAWPPPVAPAADEDEVTLADADEAELTEAEEALEAAVAEAAVGASAAGEAAVAPGTP